MVNLMFVDCSGVIDALHAANSSLDTVLVHLEVSALSASQAEEVLAQATSLVNRLGFLTCRVGDRLAELQTYIAEGERSAANQLARRTGTTVGQARRTLETGERLEKLERVVAAAATGEISPAQLEVICDAAACDPSAQELLIDTALSSSLAELRDEAGRVKANASDENERRKKIHKERYLRTFTDTDGGWNLRFRDNPERGAEIMATISSIADSLFERARSEPRRERIDAYRADALVEMARGFGVGVDPVGYEPAAEEAATGDDPEGNKDFGTEDPSPTTQPSSSPNRPPFSSTRPKVIVRIDLDALLRGYRIEGEVCEIAGFGPIAVSAVEEMVNSGDPFLAAVVARGEAVTGVVHLGRRPNARQITALQWLYPTCAVKGCSATTHLEYDHRRDWAATRFTLVDLLDRLCTFHHDRKSKEGWMLVEGKGKRAFVAPSDPRHPKFEEQSARGKAPPQAA